MRRKVAVLTQKGSLSKGVQQDTTVNLFDLDDEKVTGVENIRLEETTDNYFSLLMSIKRVSLIYADTISNDLKRLLEMIGISTKCRDDDMDNDKFINQFIFD